MDNELERALTKELHLIAKSLRIPDGSADIFIARTIDGVKKSLAKTPLITDADLARAVVRELKKYHADFAYVYEIRDIII